MKILATRKEYLGSVCADIDTIKEAYDFFNELSEEHDREELRMWANEDGTSYEIRVESIEFVFGDSEILDDLFLIRFELLDFLEEVKKIFEANRGMSSFFLDVKKW